MTKKRVTFTLSVELIEKLKETSDKTLIPQSRLVEEGIKRIIDEYMKPPK